MLAIVVSTSTLAAPKPVKGRYKCNGTVTTAVSVYSLGGDLGSVTNPIKAKLVVAKGGSFDLDVTTSGHQVSIIGTLPASYSPSFKPLFGSLSNKRYKEDSCGCLIDTLLMSGTGSQNKNGRNVTLIIEQEWYGYRGNGIYTDTYNLTCKKQV